MVSNLNSLGYEFMTNVQELSLPYSLQNKDLIVKAKTGSGKSAAFIINSINKLDVKSMKIQTLVLAPTRELANQLCEDFRKIARYKQNIKVVSITGGVPYKPQVNSLKFGAHIVVATPGRVLKHLKEENINFDNLTNLVLDEADKMLDMGFYDDINEIISYLPKDRQTLLFSATYEDNIKKIASQILKEPILIENSETSAPLDIKEIAYKVDTNNKDIAIKKIINSFRPNSVIIFCNQKLTCDELSNELFDLKYDTLVLHSDYEQKDRDEIITMFSNYSFPILIATDVASRGLDIDDVDLVINYDIPNDEKTYTHRIGRTARAGKKGTAITLYEDDKKEDIEDIFIALNREIEFDEIDDKAKHYLLDSPYRTLYLSGGKGLKLRAIDIVGALIKDIGLEKDDIGKITIFRTCSYIAIKKERYKEIFNKHQSFKIKGKFFRIYER